MACDGGRHRCRNHDRRTGQAHPARTSRARRSCSRTETALPMSTSRRSSRFHQRQWQSRDSHGRAAGRPFRCARTRRRGLGRLLPREAAWRRRLDQRRFLRAGARPSSTGLGETTRFSSANRSSRLPTTVSLAPSSIAASGSPWTRFATRTSSRVCGTPARRRGRSGERDPRPLRWRVRWSPRARHRAHGLQGLVAFEVAPGSRCRGHRLRARAGHRLRRCSGTLAWAN